MAGTTPLSTVQNITICPVWTIHADSHTRDTVFSLRTYKWIFGRIGWCYEKRAVEASGAGKTSGLSRPLVIRGCQADLLVASVSPPSQY